jgi:acetyltransferase-like isoleucine patch superfamily enzyme
VTTFGRVKLAPFEMTREGLCCIDKIQLGSEANLGNWCTIMPGTQLPSRTIVGSLTLVTRETVSDDVNGVLLGIPARKMPFVMPGNTSAVSDMSSSTSLSVCPLLFTCLGFFITKCLLIILYSSLPVAIVLIVHVILVCVLYYYLISSIKTSSHSTFLEVINRSGQFLGGFMKDFSTFVGPYLSGTQYLVFLLRAFGAQIRSDVVLSSIHCVSDPHLTTIGDHVRLNMLAHIQVRYFLYTS